jgi:orotidine-5'-phosphate decarboxylase
MVRAAVEGAGNKCDVLVVTILTSLDAAALSVAWDKPVSDVSAEVLRLAGVAKAAGAAGVVCSGAEAGALRSHFGADFSLLVPGIRLPGSPADDQSRTVTPQQAGEAGATYIILGRTVTQASDPVAALQQAVA